ncbi:MAG: hypothetical protein KDK37_04945 [Leptospiraceae bacterium]|nr:hypothetical protein [Leptospiraceae bacterium]
MKGDIPFHRSIRFKLLVSIIGSLVLLSLFLIQYGYVVARDALVQGTIEDLKHSTHLATNELRSTLNLYDEGLLDHDHTLDILIRKLAGEISQIRITVPSDRLELVSSLLPGIIQAGDVARWDDTDGLEPVDGFPAPGQKLTFDATDPDFGKTYRGLPYRGEVVGRLMRFQDNTVAVLITEPRLMQKIFLYYLRADRSRRNELENRIGLRVMRDPSTVTVEAAGDGYVYVITSYTPGWLVPGTHYPEDYSRVAIEQRMERGLPGLSTEEAKRKYRERYGRTAEEQFYHILEFMLRDNDPPLPIYTVIHPNLGFQNADSIESYGDRTIHKRKIGRDLAVAGEGVYDYWWKNPGETSPRKKIAHYRPFQWTSKDGSWSIDWVVGAAAYEDEAFAALGRIRLRIYLVSGLLVILTLLGLIYVFRHSFLNGFSELVTGSRNVLKQNFFVRIPTRGKDEIALISGAMNLLLEQIGESKQQAESIARELKVRSKSESDLQQLTRDLYVRSAMDIRSRMEGMIRVAEALQGAHFTDGVLRREVDTLLESGLRLRSFVNDFYEFSLIRSGSIPPAPSSVPVEPAIAFSFQRALEIAGLTHVDLNLIMANRNLHLHVDPVFLEAIFVNLFYYCVNRQKQGRFDLEIQDQGRWIAFQITLRDTVMKPGEAVSAFDFFAAIVDNPGAGTGLALCRLWIEALGGKITLASESDLGTRFLFTLPSRTPPAAEEKAQAPEKLESFLSWASPRMDEGDQLVSFHPPWSSDGTDLNNYARFYGSQQADAGRLYHGPDSEGFIILLMDRRECMQKAYDFQDSALVYQQALGHRGRAAAQHFVSVVRSDDSKLLKEIYRWQQWLSVPFLIEESVEVPADALRRKVMVLGTGEDRKTYYELYRPGDYLNPLREKTRTEFEKGVEEFFANRRDEAFWLFEEVLREDPSDRTASSFAYRNFWK